MASQGVLNQPSFTPPALATDTQYRWRVDVTIGDNKVTGDEMRFTTRGELVVTTNLDEDDGGLGRGTGNSLRELIADADADDTITFHRALSGLTIELNGTQLEIDKNLTIDGSSLASMVTIDAGNQSRVFAIKNTASAVAMEKLIISSGNADVGGGIMNEGSTLTLTDLEFISNAASNSGGAINNVGGSLLVDGALFASNVAAQGGGIYHDGANSGASSGSITIDRSTFSYNDATTDGGAIYSSGDGGVLSLKRSTLANNSATKGGGLHLRGGTVLLENATLAGNTSNTDEGGGLWSQGGRVPNASARDPRRQCGCGHLQGRGQPDAGKQHRCQ